VRRLLLAGLLVPIAILISAPAGAPPVVNDGHGDFVYVPAGSFRMGDNVGDGQPRERPVHVVELDAYYIAKYEMTNGEWRKFRDDPGYDDVKFWPGGRVVPKNQVPYWTQANNHGGGTPNSDEYPVLGVNWDSATAYCAWLSAKTGKKYRLPTEAEWEKAARGTDGRKYPWGNAVPDASRARFGARFNETAPVDAFAAGTSPYGVFGMSGNVWEWVSSAYRPYPYEAADGREDLKAGPVRGTRGGGHDSPAFEITTTQRGRNLSRNPAAGHHNIGFRCAR
jgi:iron(II)-dependent oxidoreductase